MQLALVPVNTCTNVLGFVGGDSSIISFPASKEATGATVVPDKESETACAATSVAEGHTHRAEETGTANDGRTGLTKNQKKKLRQKVKKQAVKEDGVQHQAGWLNEQEQQQKQQKQE